MGDHRGASREGFCGIPGRPCKHIDGSEGTDYVDVCKPSWGAWGFFMQRFTDAGVVTAKPKEFEAHHVLCVAQVEKVVIQKGQNNAFTSIVDATKWCINAKPNMMALPLWGHTVKYYTNNYAGLTQASGGGAILGAIQAVAGSASLVPPPFVNLPQHNRGHSGRTPATSYNKEIEQRLNDVITAVQEAKDNHEPDDLSNLAGALDTLSGDMQTELRARGMRGHGGTHLSWLEAVKNAADDKWYEPFSMAQEAEPMPFAGGNMSGPMAKKILDLAANMWR